PDPISINGVPRESAYVVCLVEGSFPSADFGDLHSRLVAVRVHSADELQLLVSVSMPQFAASDGGERVLLCVCVCDWSGEG
ncbi:hypothetical protein SARC_17568, partial [Sphaeroforma arctica JP610]